MNRSVAGWLAVILALGLCLRLLGIDFGLPNTNCRPDEGVLVNKALAAAGGDLNPGFFHYPSFHVYTLAGLFGACYAAGWLAGVFSTPQDFLLRYFLDPSALYLAGRLLGALLGTASIYLAYLVGRQAGGVRAGLTGAAFLSVCFLHVRDSHYLTVDVPAAFHLLLAAVLLLRFLRAGGAGWLAASALFSGIAVSTKYNAAIVVAVFAGYLCARGLARRRRSGGAPGDGSGPPVSLRHAAVFAAVTAAAAALGTPYALLDFNGFAADVLAEREHFAAGHGLDLGRGWTYHAAATLPAALGWPLYAAALAGCVVLFRAGGAPAMLVVAVLFYYAVAGAGKTVFFRYMLPLVPFLCVAAACGLERLFAAGRVRAPWRTAAVLLVAAPTLYASVRLGILLQRTDTRLLAAEWIETHVPAGSRIAMVGSGFGYPRLRPGREWLRQQHEDLRGAGFPAKSLELRLLFESYPPAPSYHLLSVLPDNPHSLRNRLAGVSPEQLLDSGVRWVVTQSHPLPVSQVDPEFARQLRRHGEAAAQFTSMRGGSRSRASFEMTDAFYVPWAGFGAVDRPGPELTIYRLGRAGE